MTNNFRLGNRLRDRVTGFVGIADSRTEFLSGCVRYGLQAEVSDKDPGKVPDLVWIDVERLEFVDVGLADLAVKPSGGDRVDHPSRGRSPA